MTLLCYYRQDGLSSFKASQLAATSYTFTSERCYYIESSRALTSEETFQLVWLLSDTFAPTSLSSDSFLTASCSESDDDDFGILEIGPRLSFSTPWCSNALAICHSIGLRCISRMEQSTRYRLRLTPSCNGSSALVKAFLPLVMDRMTQQVYPTPLTTFTSAVTIPLVFTLPLLSQGLSALASFNQAQSLGFDEWDLAFYTSLFVTSLQRNPTNVEVFDLAQSNSEHSRHWFFGGQLILDGEKKDTTLFQLVKSTLTAATLWNSIIAFHDNSSVIAGTTVSFLRPMEVTRASPLALTTDLTHVLLTAETHNFPTGIAPYAGAETGTGGRIRDVQATGQGAHVMAGISAYCVGNLNLPEYPLPWEDASWTYPSHMASPSHIVIEASNGASAYGNQFGEPVVAGFCRSAGLVLPDQTRREWIKPIMFSAGVGQLSASHCVKGDPEVALWVVKVGGPCYRIGLGGGAASSRPTDPKACHAAALTELDFNAVQRGDAEMENKMNRVIRGCIELGTNNPIVSIHDQGAGGNGNVLKEIVAPSGQCAGGARYELRDLLSGDASLSVLELWGAEYQENNALLIRSEHLDTFQALCARESAPWCAVGQVTGDGKVTVWDAWEQDTQRKEPVLKKLKNEEELKERQARVTPVDLPLALVLADMPQKTFTDTTLPRLTHPLVLPTNLSLREAADRVLRLLSVASKRFLVTKVDRSVTGLVAQQSCVGPLQLPLANVAVLAQSHIGLTGIATAVGEQPMKGLLSPAIMARSSVGEALTNLVWASLTDGLASVKCSANWMWAAKCPGEAVAMYDAVDAMTTYLKGVGVAVDGGKDSLTMSVTVNDTLVKAPGALVITCYAAVNDITRTITPDFKWPRLSLSLDSSLVTQTSHNNGPLCPTTLVLVDLSDGTHHLGGTALAQVYGQLGDAVVDTSASALFAAAFGITQSLLKENTPTTKVLYAGHDKSDGGLLTTLCEMAFAGNGGFQVDIRAMSDKVDPLAFFYSEGLGLVLQLATEAVSRVSALYHAVGISVLVLGIPTVTPELIITWDGQTLMQSSMVEVREVWEATGAALNGRQTTRACADAEERSVTTRRTPAWYLSFTPTTLRHPVWPLPPSSPRIGICREEGSNGDREMSSAFFAAGFEVWDLTMNDLKANALDCLATFTGLAFVGGFSYADVLGSAKGWAAGITFHPGVMHQLTAFRARDTTFSLGVCNGCQLMTLLGWVGLPPATPATSYPRFLENQSGRFESRFSSVTILDSPSVLLSGMAGSTMGIWTAHGEGQVHFPDPAIKDYVLNHQLAPLRYVNDLNEITTRYPYNPNGSCDGIAALTSLDGRHLAMMPHPERCFLSWQWPWMPLTWEAAYTTAPWLRLFQNAYTFVTDARELREGL